MNDKPKLETHDERQSAYRGDGGDASVDGRGRQDPSAADTADAAPPQNGQPQAYYPRGHGHGGGLGEGEPDGHAERDGQTQPNFGQSGTYGKQDHQQAQQRARADSDSDSDSEGDDT